LVNRARESAQTNSQALSDLKSSLKNPTHGKQVCLKLEAADVNKDGAINVNGWKSALLLLTSQLHLSDHKLEEVFYLICN